MRLSRFFINESLEPGEELTLPAHLVNYIVNVLRLKAETRIILFNGREVDQHSGEYSATLTEVSKRHCTVQINSFIIKEIESPLRTHLFQGISRSERMDYSIQKAIELGVSSITPVFTLYSNAKKLNEKQLQKKMTHWQGIARSACEQSGRTTLVTINKPIQAQQIGELDADIKLLLSPIATSGISGLSLAQTNTINIFIGPEGGLSNEEISLAVNQGYQEIRLGKRVLRTETAGLAILSILQFLSGDLA